MKTRSVVLSYPETLPDFVYIGFVRYKVKPYITQAIRCNKCQGFGHVAAHCKRQVWCVRCGKGHAVDECPHKDDLTKAVCVNCKVQHSAAFKGCSKAIMDFRGINSLRLYTATSTIHITCAHSSLPPLHVYVTAYLSVPLMRFYRLFPSFDNVAATIRKHRNHAHCNDDCMSAKECDHYH